jgi:hypothetical protein
VRKLRVRKLSKEIDESVVTPVLVKYWKNNYDALAYLNKRFEKGDATGDFLKAIIGARE